MKATLKILFFSILVFGGLSLHLAQATTENYTLFKVNDTNSRFTIIASRITWANLLNTEDAHYIAMNHTGDGIEFGDVDHFFDIYIDEITATANQNARAVLWGMSDYSNDLYYHDDNNDPPSVFVVVSGDSDNHGANEYQIGIYAWDGTDGFNDIANTVEEGFLNEDTTYYLRVKKIHTTLTLDVYGSSANRTLEAGALVSLSCTAPSDAFQYVYGIASCGYGAGGHVSNGYVENLDLRPLARPDSVNSESQIWSIVDDNNGTAQIINDHRREPSNILYDPDEADPDYRYKYYMTDRALGDDIYLYNSSNGATWTNHGKVLDGAKSDEDPYIVLVNSTYLLYWERSYDGQNYIHRVESNDGITWTNNQTILTPSGSGWEKDQTASPLVYVEDGIYYLFYEGGIGNPAMINASIGLAHSQDGLNFVRYSENPVLSPTFDNTDWDYDVLVPQALVKIGDWYVMSYHARDNLSVYSSGLAYSLNLNGTWKRTGQELVYTDANTTVGNLKMWDDPNSDDILALYLDNVGYGYRGKCKASIGVDAINGTVNFYSQWVTEAGISHLAKYIFSWNNSGAWVNDTATSFSGGWANVTKTITAARGQAVRYKIYMNTSEGREFTSPTEALLVGGSGTPYPVSFAIWEFTGGGQLEINGPLNYALIAGADPGGRGYVAYIDWAFKAQAQWYNISRDVDAETDTLAQAWLFEHIELLFLPDLDPDAFGFDEEDPDAYEVVVPFSLKTGILDTDNVDVYMRVGNEAGDYSAWALMEIDYFDIVGGASDPSDPTGPGGPSDPWDPGPTDNETTYYDDENGIDYLDPEEYARVGVELIDMGLSWVQRNGWIFLVVLLLYLAYRSLNKGKDPFKIRDTVEFFK